MSDVVEQPEWPTSGHASKEQAIASALEEMRAEGEIDPVVLIHRPLCAVRFDGECDCGPEIVRGREVEA